ncbi:MAG: signal peptidase II [Eisenbergiella sp.]
MNQAKKSALVRARPSLTLAVLILFLLSLGQKGNGLLKTGLAFLLGGAFSNTYDRLSRKYVVDYVSLRTGIGAVDRVVFIGSAS